MHVKDTTTEKHLNNGRSTTTECCWIQKPEKTELELFRQQSQLSVSITTTFDNIMSSLNLNFATMLE